MSAASPAHPDGPGRTPRLAAVVVLNDSTRPRRRPRRERTSVPPQPTGPLSPEQRLAATLESVFARHGRSLTDEHTALDVRIAFGEIRRLLAGALEQGMLTEDQFHSLDGMVAGMEAAPALLG